MTDLKDAVARGLAEEKATRQPELPINRGKKITREVFVAWAKANGWTEDRYGHLLQTRTDVAGTHEYRYKLTKVIVRYETRVGTGENKRHSRWIRLQSAYFGKMYWLNETATSGIGGWQR